jgi:hypothetical protein
VTTVTVALFDIALPLVPVHCTEKVPVAVGLTMREPLTPILLTFTPGPVMEHEVVFVENHETVDICPDDIDVGLAVTVRVGLSMLVVGAGAATTPTETLFDTTPPGPVQNML